MKVALVDNGSLEPAAHTGLRKVAAEVAQAAGLAVEAVSWRHSDRVPAVRLSGKPAWTLGPWIRAQLAAGERHFLLLPFFVSPGGAIGSLIRRDLERIRAREGAFEWTVAEGIGEETLARILAERARQALASRGLVRPAAILVDHGGPSGRSAGVRDAVAGRVREILGTEVSGLTAASMEASEDDPSISRPLFSEVLGRSEYDSGEVLILPLFLLPGRHAGKGGDLERIAAAACGPRCHFAELAGSHPLAVERLSANLTGAWEPALQS